MFRSKLGQLGSEENSGIELENGIPADKLREHITTLMHKLNPEDVIFNGFDEEFNYIESRTAQQQAFGDYKSAMQSYNRNKNRFSGGKTLEPTRVVLSTITNEEGSDFINANWISGFIPGAEKVYIATQGPLPSTFGDFWRMVWESDSAIVVMLTREVESGKLKCDHYWPEVGEPLTAGNFEITITDTEEIQRLELIERKLTIHNLQTKTSRPVLQLQYIAWPDHGLPTSTTAFLSLLDDAYKFNNTNGPLVVHCSAGIGRTGTFCVVHSTIEKFKLDLKENPDKLPELSIVKAVLAARSQRPGMVQTKEQYMFVYLAILEKTEELLLKHKEQRKLQRK